MMILPPRKKKGRERERKRGRKVVSVREMKHLEVNSAVVVIIYLRFYFYFLLSPLPPHISLSSSSVYVRTYCVPVAVCDLERASDMSPSMSLIKPLQWHEGTRESGKQM